jgi:hypothetical protein
VSGQFYAPATLPPEKEPRYPLNGRLNGPQSRSGRHREEKILDPTWTQLRLLGCPARSQSLYRLSYPGSTTKGEELENVNQLVFGMSASRIVGHVFYADTVNTGGFLPT